VISIYQQYLDGTITPGNPRCPLQNRKCIPQIHTQRL